jgi:polysaccharide pyruvyl transferase WcaK-like protein
MTSTSRLESNQPTILPRTTPALRGALPSDASSRATARGHRKHPKSIGLFGLFGCGNSGNDGSLEAMLDFVRQARPDATVTCICSAQGGASERIAWSLRVDAIPLGIPRPATALLGMLDRLLLTLPRRAASLLRAILRARRLDALIVPGTGILDDFGESPFGMPLTLLTWCLAARLSGASIAFVSIGAGPIEHPLSRWLMRTAVGLAHYRSYRDTISKEFMESIGFDARDDAVYPDIAFKLPVPAARSRPRPGRRLVVGVGVMTYLGWRNDAVRGASIYQEYLEKLTTFVLWLLDTDCAVRILMGDAADLRAVDELLANVRAGRPGLAEGRLLFDPMSSLHDLMRQIAGTDVVVATRYHNVVCALKLGKPTVSVGYAKKNDVLMAEMGLGRFCQHVEHLNVRLLIEQFGHLVADRQRYACGIEAASRACRGRLGHQDSLLAERLL